MHRVMLPRAAVIAAVLAAGCHSRATPPSGDVGAALTEARLDGTPFDPKTLHGKPALVAFWRPGCEYCAAALPKVLAAAHASGAVPVAIMVRGASSKGTEELGAMGWDGPELADSAGLVERYQIAGVPYTLVLRGDGTAAAAFDGDVATTDDLSAAVAAAK
jgi:thiol-disulfide isomerase/thioredoxin